MVLFLAKYLLRQFQQRIRHYMKNIVCLFVVSGEIHDMAIWKQYKRKQGKEWKNQERIEAKIN